MALSLNQGVLVILLGISLLFVFRAARSILLRYLTPIRHLRGPPSKSILFGNFWKLGGQDTVLNREWTEKYGGNFMFRLFFQIPRLYTTDLRTIHHILTHSMEFFKPEESRRDLARIVGQGILVAEGEKHRQQRRIMNPAFGPAQIRELTEIFLEKANELCEYWNNQISAGGGSIRTNVIDGLSKTTLDIIGLAGFNYEFQALNTNIPPNELNQAFHQIFKQPPKISYLAVVLSLFPALTFIRDERTRMVDDARDTMLRIARQIFQEKKAEVMREYSENKLGNVEKSSMQGRDLLTLLIKANMATDIPESQRLTDEEVLAQVPTFLTAGHETTSTATTWCLSALTQAPHIQQKLREELLTVTTDMPSMEELQELPYLDQVVRETLRLHAPVCITFRTAVKDDILPISEPIVDRSGNILNEIHVSAGTGIIIPILALQTSSKLWGEDALEFKPERWSNPPEAVASMPGVWSHLLTFLGGPHACIGYRFSVIEMKALVFTLIRTFEFELAVPKDDIDTLGVFIQRPCLRSDREKGAQLPLIIRPYQSS